MRKINFLYLLLLSLWQSSLFASTDKYRLILNDDPATTITVAWNQISGNNAIVYYDTQDHGQNYAQYTNQKTVDLVNTFRGMNNCFAKLTGLQANTNYYFVIKDEDGTSKRFWFKTAPNDRSQMSFIAGGDSRNNRIPRRNANLLVSKLKPTAVLFGGDMTAYDNNMQWKQWFEDWQLTTASDGRMFPIVPARGNHEQADTVYKLFNTTNENSYYALTFGDNFFRVYTLNTEISVFGNQLDWLKNDLETHKDTYWKATQYHKPMRPHTSRKAEGIDRYNAWAKLFYHNAVRLAVECDSHMVKTTYPVKPDSDAGDEGFLRDDQLGTVYVGEGCWGAPLRNNDDDKSWTRASGSFNQFKWIFVKEDKIEVRTINVNNATQVGENTNENTFAIPENLNIWTMPDGENVVHIKPSTTLNLPEIKFSDNMPTDFTDKTKVNISVEVIQPGNGVANIVLSAKNMNKSGETISLGTITNSPYQINVSLPENGQYLITAKVNSTDGLNASVIKIINVGDFEITAEIPINSSRNDVEEGEGNNGYMYFSSSDLELGYDIYIDQKYQKVGLRFENVFIPKGANILSTKIRFKSKRTRGTPAETTISMENTVNSSKFTDEAYNLSHRNFLAEKIVWQLPKWKKYEISNNTTSPELKTLIKSVIENNQWKSGNAITFMFTPTGSSLESTSNKRYPYSIDGDSENPPTLIVKFNYSASSSATIETEKLENLIKLFPNPAKNWAEISFSGLSLDDFQSELYNTEGKRINIPHEITSQKKIRYNLTTLPSGIYYIRLYNNKNKIQKTFKLIKKL